jgi:Spy/CpxP family protein refolding chaperone
MSKLRFVIPTLCVAAVAASFVGRAIADPATDGTSPPPGHSHWQGRHHGGDEVIHEALHQLGLTAEQKTQIHSIMAAAKAQGQAQFASSRATHEALEVTAPTDPKYPQLIAEAQADASAHVQQRAAVWSQIFAVLTPAQQARFPSVAAAIQAQHEARRAAWMAQHAAPTTN